jgi:hypothetical protein
MTAPTLGAGVRQAQMAALRRPQAAAIFGREKATTVQVVVWWIDFLFVFPHFKNPSRCLFQESSLGRDMGNRPNEGSLEHKWRVLDVAEGETSATLSPPLLTSFLHGYSYTL